MIFNEHSHARLAELFRTPGYAGYKPDVAEAPNGDTVPCEACAGSGFTELYDVECSACSGRGRVPNVDDGICECCRGTGEVP